MWSKLSQIMDIGKRPGVTDVINIARKITNFIYNHGWLLAQMKKYCGGDIVRPGVTRHGVGSDLELLQVVHDIFAKLDPTTESLEDSMIEWRLQQGQPWPIHLDDEIGNPDPRIATHAQEFEVNVERVLSKEVHFESFRKDTEDSFHVALNSHQEVDSRSASHNSRPSVVGTFASLLLGSFEFMSIRTQFSDSSNEANVYPPHVMSYVQPSSSTNEEYGMPSYSPSTRMSYQVSYHMEGGFDINTWVNLEYRIHVEVVGRTREIYAWHVRIFNQYY
ncbi:hypothetical protein AAG906_003730 [Vitis piasezkii]